MFFQVCVCSDTRHSAINVRNACAEARRRTAMGNRGDIVLTCLVLARAGEFMGVDKVILCE